MTQLDKEVAALVAKRDMADDEMKAAITIVEAAVDNLNALTARRKLAKSRA